MLDELRAESGTKPSETAGRAQRADLAGLRRQGAGQLERADDRLIGPGRQRAGRTALLASRGRRRPTFMLRTMRRADGRLLHCLAQRTRRSSTPIWTIIPASSTPWSRCTKPASTSAGSTRPCELADMHADALQPTRAGGGFFFTADDHEQLIARHKDLQDSSVPSGNAMAATMLLRLGKLCGRSDYLAAAEQTLQTFVDWMEKSPTATGQMLLGLDMQLGPTPELVILGDDDDTRAVLTALHRRFWPNKARGQATGQRRVCGAGWHFRGQNFRSFRPDAVCMRELRLPGTGAWQGSDSGNVECKEMTNLE